MSAMSATRPHTMSPGLIVLLLSLLLGIQPMATDLYLPALPALTRDLNASMGQTQLTLSAMLLAFGVSQLVWGPLSDRFGRRPILLWGMASYTVAAVLGMFAASIETLIVWRTVQGAAMGAAVMCGRAMIRDLYQPAEGARVMSKALSGLGVIACASAPLGGIVTELWGWRVTLAGLAVFSATTLVLLLTRLQETVPQRNPQALQPRVLWATWRGIVRSPTFWAFALLTACTYLGLFTFLAASSFVFMGVLGLSKPQYGLIMLFMTLAYIGGTFFCRRLLARFGVRRSVAIGAGFSVAGGTLMGVLALSGHQSVWGIIGPFLLFMVAHGIHQPCGQSGAVAPFPHAAGAASALSGFVMMVVAFAMGSWMGQQLGSGAAPSVLPLTNGVWFSGTLVGLVAWTLVQRYGEARPVPQRTPHPQP